MKRYEMQKHLVLSTSHITKKDAYLLNNTLLTLIRDYLAYGWRVYVGNDDTVNDIIRSAKKAGLGLEFRALLRLAYRLKCPYLVLDRDGQERDDLPVFDW